IGATHAAGAAATDLESVPGPSATRRGSMDDDPESRDALILDNDAHAEREFALLTQGPQWWKIYGLHFLFKWNARTFEYVAVRTLSETRSSWWLRLSQTASPQPPSGSFVSCSGNTRAHAPRGIIATLSSIVFSSSVGAWIDRSRNQAKPFLTSVVVNHSAIVLTYLAWMLWPALDEHDSAFSRNILFGTILVLDVIQNLSATGNSLSLSRDWIPSLVGVDPSSEQTLTQVNAVIARVDLFCKVASPSLLPIIISTFSRNTWIALVTISTLSVWCIEILCLRRVTRENPRLLSPRVQSKSAVEAIEGLMGEPKNLFRRVSLHLCHRPLLRIRQFFSMAVWPASITTAFLYLTVLVYSATLITYLLQRGFSLGVVTIARTSGSLMGFIATFTTPVASSYLTRRLSLPSTNGVVARKLGSWGITGQFLALVSPQTVFLSSLLTAEIPVVLVLWNLPPSSPGVNSPAASTASQASFLTTVTLFGFLSLSRLFLWTYSLMEQEIEQSEVPASQRSTFSGTGESFRSCFDLLHWTATVVWSRPEEFKGLAGASLCVVGGSALWFSSWARRSRPGSSNGTTDKNGRSIYSSWSSSETRAFSNRSQQPKVKADLQSKSCSHLLYSISAPCALQVEFENFQLLAATMLENRKDVAVAAALAAALLLIWASLINIRGAGLFYEPQPSLELQAGEDGVFLRHAMEVEFPAPIDYAPIREVCTREPSQFRAGLLFSCEEQHGGVGMVRNQILKCLRYAIHAGAAVVVPSMSKRNPQDISDIETSNEVPLEYLFDRDAFITHLTNACPGMRLYNRAEDFPNYAQRAGEPLSLIGDQFEPAHPRTGLEHPQEWRGAFNDWLEENNARPSSRAPVLVQVGQSYIEYPVHSDGDAFAYEFGKILSFRPDTRALAARVLLALKQQFGLLIDPTQAISPGAFYGAHLRLEKDAVWAWDPAEWRFSRTKDQFEEQYQNILKSRLEIVYVASGDRSVVDQFAQYLHARLSSEPDGGLRNVTVVTKHDLLLQGGVRRRLDALTFDQQALVDFLIMFKASAFMGVAHSSFPWTVALRRHELSRYAAYANRGSDILQDEYSTIMGMRADYPYVDPFEYGLWP
ncbi:putative Solute carrier family 40 member 1, partial [Diplocarpon rosae]